MQDPQLGRFWQQDKFADKYIDLSPYQYAAGNPIKYIDKNGDSLTVVGKQDAVQGFKDITNQGLGGFYNVQQNESGTYSLVSTGKDGEMTDQQQAFYDAMNGVMAGAKDVSLIAVMNDPKVDFGSFQSGTIDVGDMMKFNSINDPNATGSTREGLLAHEVVEQGELANSGVNKSDLQAMKDAFGPMHKDAIQVENQVNGSTRMSDMERTRIGDKTYTKYFLGKNGITVEKTTNFTNNMQVDKRSLQIGVLKPQ
jgi:uncharacterized protein RhaS with RHS repeats